MDPVDPLIRPFLLSSWFCSFLFMAEILGTYYYVVNYWSKDRSLLKGTVVASMTIDLLGIIFQLVQVDFYIRYNWGPSTVMATIVAGLAQGTNAYIVQLFLSWRFWTLSKNVVFTVILVSVATTSFVGIWGLSMREVFFHNQSDTPSYRPYFIVWLASGVAADVVIAIALVFLLSTMNSEIRSTRSIIHKVIIITLGTGSVTAVLATAMLVLYLLVPSSNYTAVGMPLGRLYTLNMLIILLSRKKIRGTSQYPDVSLNYISVQRSTIQTTSPAQVSSGKESTSDNESNSQEGMQYKSRLGDADFSSEL